MDSTSTGALSLTENSLVWVRNSSANHQVDDQGRSTPLFNKGKVKQLKTSPNLSQQSAIVLLESNETSSVIEVNANYLLPRDPSQSSIQFEDMVKMTTLNEAELLQNIKTRYSNNEIFTYIGPTLIVMNPYKELNHQFSQTQLSRFQQSVSTPDFQLDSYPPHIFAIAAAAYTNLLITSKRQSIVISGESGAGKTENAKYAMRCLTQISQIDSSLASPNPNQNQEGIEDKILSCNPLLEAFGNAKTVRNDNSSRFGKYVKILVSSFHKNKNINNSNSSNSSAKIVGAEITKYLLEKSRVIHVSNGERNYHIFYHLIQGADPQILRSTLLHNKSVSDFSYLSQSSCTEIPQLDDRKQFKEIIDSIHKMKFDPNLETTIFQVLSAILYLGNLEFNDSNYDVNTACTIQNPEILSTICYLLAIDSHSILIDALTHKTRIIPGQTILSPIPKQECINNRNTLSKALYDRLFMMLVDKLNEGIAPTYSLSTNHQQLTSIGLLDIFGFENFTVNSFEQLCINYTNEYLQQLYITYVFKNEQNVFVADGLSEYLNNLTFVDNQSILDTFDGSAISIFSILNESCLLKNNDDQKFLAKLKEKNKDNQKLQFPKLSTSEIFSISHTQSIVEYNVDQFREKNMDELSSSLSSALLQSKNQHVITIFESAGSSRKDSLPQKSNLLNSSNPTQTNSSKYLCSKFKAQMAELMGELYSSDVHFVRCIKPNELKRKDCFIESYVMQQIRYLGVLESIEVRKHTYPIRKEFKQFFLTYRTCSDRIEYTKRTDYISLCQELLQECMKESFVDSQVLFGKTKVYLKQEFERTLDIKKNVAITRKQTAASLRIQRAYRRLRKQKAYKNLSKRLFNISYDKLFTTFLHSFDSIKEVSEKKLIQKFVLVLEKYKKSIMIRAFYDILEKLLIFKAVKAHSDQTIIIQENDHNNYDSNVSDQSVNASQFGTVQVEVNTSGIPENKLYYQGQQEPNEEFDNERNSKQDFSHQNLINLQNYNSQMVKDWNKFEVSEMNHLEGDTILIDKPGEQENSDSTYFRELLDKKIQEQQLPNVTPNLAEDSRFQLSEIEETVYEEIKQLNLLSFYKLKLNKRSNMLGKKSEKEILTFKKKPLGKGSLIALNPIEDRLALQHFSNLIQFIAEPTSSVDLLIVHINSLIHQSMKQSIQFLNEITTQIIKQLNGNKKEDITIKLLQYLKVFLYCFTPEDEFLNILLHFLVFWLYENQWSKNQKVKDYILYNIPSIIRKVDQENPRQSQFFAQIPTNQLQALILRQQITIHILFCTGSSVSIEVDAWDSFHLLKTKVLNKLKINSERIRPDYLQIFDMSFDENIVNERMMLPDTYVWDILYKQNQKNLKKLHSQQQQQHQQPQNQQQSSGTFSIFMIRVLCPFTLYSIDWTGVSLVYCQVYFEIYVGKHVVDDLRKLAQLIALAKIINDFSDHLQHQTIEELLPLTLDSESRAKSLELTQVEFTKIKRMFSLHEAKFIFLKIAKESEYFLGYQVPISYITSESEELSNIEYFMVLKPTYFFIITSFSKKKILLYEYSQIVKWGRNVEDSKNHLLIVTNDEVKHLIQSDQTEQIDFYLHEAKNLISSNRIKSPTQIEEYLSYSRYNSQSRLN